MKDILFLAHRIPFPPDRGDKIRSWHLLEHLASLARVHLACFADDAADAAHLPALREALGGRLGEAHVEVRSRGKVAAGALALIERRADLAQPVRQPDAARASSSGSSRTTRVGTVFAFSGPDGAVRAREACASASSWISATSIRPSSRQYADDGAGPMRWINRREGEKLSAFERATAARADLCLFVSEAEAALFRARTGLANIRALSNGIDVDFFDPEADFPRLREGGRGRCSCSPARWIIRPMSRRSTGSPARCCR